MQQLQNHRLSASAALFLVFFFLNPSVSGHVEATRAAHRQTLLISFSVGV
jgi:hypothetical protein